MTTSSGIDTWHEKYVTHRDSSNHQGVVEVNTVYGSLWGTPGDNLAYLDALLRGLREQHHDSSMYRKLDLEFVRVEFVYRPNVSPHVGLMGAILFDQNRQPTLHLYNAWLGNDDANSRLSRDLLALLGAPAELFEDINADVHPPEPYMVVVHKNTDDTWTVARTL